ncbi:MAG: YqaJ viral recombinase family protein [Sulfuricaulis sp.]|nr:YqaJ viral recombinase family protein [Sulfuricaulis sp.]
MTIIIECDQGSPEWHQARAGCITASMFKVARSRLKTGKNAGDFTVAAKDYAFRVAIERISGVPLDEGFENWAMQRGHELEPDARMEHEAQTGLLVHRAGFVTTEDRRFGASADGLIGEDGGAEYKCLVAPDKLRGIYIEEDFSDYVDQVQGCLWLTGRKWWHFALYCPALESIGQQFWHRHVDRDDDYIEALETDLMAFAAMVDGFEKTLRQRAA